MTSRPTEKEARSLDALSLETSGTPPNGQSLYFLVIGFPEPLGAAPPKTETTSAPDAPPNADAQTHKE